MSVAFTVRGLAVPQGSVRAFPAAEIGGKIRVVNTTPALDHWRTAIGWHARAAMGKDPLMDGPLHARIEFVLPRPASVSRRYPAVVPDLDKLVRAAFDAMENVVYVNDSRIVSLSTRKTYGDAPGVVVAVEEMEP